MVVVDWGGAKARAGLIELGADGAARVVVEEVLTFSDSDKRGAPEPVLDLIARAVGRVVRAQGVAVAPLGFIYSYPARLERIDRAVALASTKGWALKDLEGQDVAALLSGALRREGLERIRIAAVANDTVATLMLQSYRARGRSAEARPADVGLILGTGANLAADLGRRASGISSPGTSTGWPAWKPRTMPRSTASSPSRARVSSASRRWSPGTTWARSCGGHCETWGRARRAHWAAPSGLAAPFALDSEDLSRLAADRTPGLDGVDALLRALGVPSTGEERREVRALGAAIARRARGWSGPRSSARCASSTGSSRSGAPRWTVASGAATRASRRSSVRSSSSCSVRSGRAGSRPRT